MRYLTATELKNTHREYAHGVLEKFAAEEVRPDFQTEVFNRHYDALFEKRDTGKILDCGTASGGFIEQLKREGYKKLYGFDIDDYVKPATKKILTEFRIVDASWERLPWGDNFFHAAAVWCLLPHLENPFHCVREVHRVLGANGFCIVQVPNIASKAARNYFAEHADFRSYKEKNNHIVIFTKNIMTKTVLKYFDCIDTVYDVRPKIFSGPKGVMRKFLYTLSSLHRPWRQYFDSRWGYAVVWVLKKKNI